MPVMNYEASVRAKVGDIIYFYFMHVFCVPGRINIDHAERSTGKFEMRCRPARVVAVNPSLTPTGFDEFDALQANNLPLGQLHLDVEFEPDDRVPAPGGCGVRPDRHQMHVGAHLGRDCLGVVGSGWPDPQKWAYTAKTIDD